MCLGPLSNLNQHLELFYFSTGKVSGLLSLCHVPLSGPQPCLVKRPHASDVDGKPAERNESAYEAGRNCNRLRAWVR